MHSLASMGNLECVPLATAHGYDMAHTWHAVSIGMVMAVNAVVEVI